MSNLQALLLGIVQGITEFLPVSSSGHLILLQYFLGFQSLSDWLFFDLICHLGTLGAIFIVLRKEIWEVLRSGQKCFQVGVALLPLFALLPFMKSIKGIFDQPGLLGYCFLATSFILFLGIRFGRSSGKENSLLGASIIGIFQAFAIIPGISRSGTTISTARILGWSPIQSVVFSFILSIPTILGGMTLETYKLLKEPAALPPLHLSHYLIGFSASLIVGYFSLSLLIKIIDTAKFQVFCWYTAALGILTLLYFSI
jgi:undecaprenyl-diphosphatase